MASAVGDNECAVVLGESSATEVTVASTRDEHACLDDQREENCVELKFGRATVEISR